MYKLILSFISGFLTKAYFTSIALKFIKVLLFFKKNETHSEFKFYFVCKLKRKIFNGKLNYFPNKQVLKLQLFDGDNFFIKNRDVEIQEILEWNNLDTNHFNKMGDVYLYVHYPGGIKIYSETDTITPSDFHTTENKFDDVLCCSVISPGIENKYITNYFKLYGNNKKLTPELILLNYDKFDEPLAGVKFSLIKSGIIKEYLFDEQI
jgi:hypothetical protein